MFAFAVAPLSCLRLRTTRMRETGLYKVHPTVQIRNRVAAIDETAECRSHSIRHAMIPSLERVAGMLI